MNIKIMREKEQDLWKKAGNRLISMLKKDRKTLLLISGGSTVGLYDCIKYHVLNNKGKNLIIAQVDERFKPGKVSDINSVAIRKTGLWDWCETDEVPYYIVSQKGTLKFSADNYNETMEKIFKECDFRIAVLGIGEDGHTAGLIPGYSQLWDKEKLVVGYELKNKQISNFKFQISKLKVNHRQRISLTPFALRRLDYVLVAAVGERKWKVIEKLKGDKGNRGDKSDKVKLNEFPAKIILEIPRVDLFTDVT